MKMIPNARRGSCALFLQEKTAQGTVEYALVTTAILAIAVSLALLWRASEQGTLAKLVEAAASHGIDPMGLLDIVLF